MRNLWRPRLRALRRVAWQVFGVAVGVGAVVGLGVGSFGCASSPSPAPTARVTPHPSPTVDPRVAAVKEATRRYIEAIEASALTGDPSGVDALVVPGSQAAGNAGIASSFSRSNGYNFISSRVDYDEQSWRVTSTESSAVVDVRYALYGHSADWPSLRARDADHTTQPSQMHLAFELRNGQWLVAQSS